MAYPFHEFAIVEVSAPPERLFERLDDQARLAAHMEKPSMMMLGGRMTYAFDDHRGRAVGSVIHMGGSILGIALGVDEVVTERAPPRRKVWETVGHPRLLIIGAYRMGFEIEPKGGGSQLHVFIDYAHPASPTGRVLGRLFAKAYARWCVRRMAQDAASLGEPTGSQPVARSSVFNRVGRGATPVRKIQLRGRTADDDQSTSPSHRLVRHRHGPGRRDRGGPANESTRPSA